MNGKSKIWALALLVIALLVGAAGGVTVDRLALNRPGEAESRREDRDRRASYLDWLSSELELSEAQRAQVAQIIDRQRERMSGLWSDIRPRYEEMKVQARAEIRGVLNEKQRAAYEALLKREEERRQRRHKEGTR